MQTNGFHLKVMALATENRKEVERFVKFAVVGAVGALVDFGVLNALVLLVGLSPAWANPFSVSAAIMSNFIWNRLWTFPESRQRPFLTQFGQFALVNLVGLLINQLIFVTALHLTSPAVPHPWDYNISKAVAIGLVLFWNFGVNRVWTYRGL